MGRNKRLDAVDERLDKVTKVLHRLCPHDGGLEYSPTVFSRYVTEDCKICGKVLRTIKAETLAEEKKDAARIEREKNKRMRKKELADELMIYIESSLGVHPCSNLLQLETNYFDIRQMIRSWRDK